MRRPVPPVPAGDRAAGFTLIEILVVIAILGMLAAIVVPSVLPAHAEARRQAARADIAQIAQAVKLYMIEHGAQLPAWDDLVRPERGRRRYLDNLTRAKRDPWKRVYVITADPDAPKEPLVYSLGENGIDEGGGGDDISSRELGDGDASDM